MYCMLFTGVAEYCQERSRKRGDIICVSCLPLHLWAIFPSSNSFSPCACSSGTQIRLEDWCVLNFHKSLLNIALFFYTCHANSLSVGRLSIEPRCKRFCNRPSQLGCRRKQTVETFSRVGGSVVTTGSCI